MTNNTKHAPHAKVVWGEIDGQKRIVGCQAVCPCGLAGETLPMHSARAEADAHRVAAYQGRLA